MNPHADDELVAGDESAESGDQRVDRVVRTRAQAPPDEEAVWPVAGDAARHPARDAPASWHDARAAPYADVPAAYAAAQSACDAQAAVDALWGAAEAEYAAQAAAESGHDARAAPGAARNAPAVNVVRGAAEPASAARAAAQSTHDARAAPDAHTWAGEDAPCEDMAGQVQARLRDLTTTWDANRVRARAQLLALGVEADTADHLARHYHPERVLAWCAYARRQAGLHNPAGYVVQRIMRGLPPPVEAQPREKRWYSDEEYARFFAQ